MARDNILDDLFNIALKIPWWANFIIAILAYFIFDSLSQLEAPPINESTILTDTVKHSMITSISFGLKYIIPFPLLLGGSVSLIKKLIKK